MFSNKKKDEKSFKVPDNQTNIVVSNPSISVFEDELHFDTLDLFSNDYYCVHQLMKFPTSYH